MRVRVDRETSFTGRSGDPINPGEQRIVSFRLTPSEAMAHYDGRRGFVVEAGTYELAFGASSRDLRATTRLIVR